MNKNLPSINHETVVFTKHARERLDLRRLGEDTIIHVMRKPDTTYKTNDGKIKFIAKTMGTKVHVIGKPIPEENKWLVISLWVRGEDDAGNFVNRRRSRRKDQDIFAQIFNVMFALVVLFIIAVVYYYTQGG